MCVQCESNERHQIAHADERDDPFENASDSHIASKHACEEDDGEAYLYSSDENTCNAPGLHQLLSSVASAYFLPRSVVLEIAGASEMLLDINRSRAEHANTQTKESAQQKFYVRFVVTICVEQGEKDQT